MLRHVLSCFCKQKNPSKSQIWATGPVYLGGPFITINVVYNRSERDLTSLFCTTKYGPYEFRACKLLSLYSTATPTPLCWGLALGNTPNAKMLRYLYQHVGIYLKTFVDPTPTPGDPTQTPMDPTRPPMRASGI